MKPFFFIILKRKLENIFIFPFIWLGRMIARMKKLDDDYDIFFFFPFYHIGGAEKVHANIARAFKDKKAIIFFTKKSHNDLFLHEFQAAGHVIRDISSYTDNKWKYWNNLLYRGIISAYINRQKSAPIVFNGQCNFAYKLSPWINTTIAQLELIHSLNSFSYIRVPFMQYYRNTVMISQKRIDDHFRLYDLFGIPPIYKNRIVYILNGIQLPEENVSKDFFRENIQVLYVGRGGPEKRVHVVARIAKSCTTKNLPVEFEFLGDVSEVITKASLPQAKFWGNQNDSALIDQIYDKADVLIITSLEEGFPMVVMEAMARGCIILGTPVGDMPIHIRQGVNGFLFTSISNEDAIVSDALMYLENLLRDSSLREQIFTNNITYASLNFGLTKFEKAYQELFESVKPSH